MTKISLEQIKHNDPEFYAAAQGTANLFYRGHAHDTKDTKEFFVIRR